MKSERKEYLKSQTTEELRAELVALMDKWAGYKRVGSSKHPTAYEFDRVRRFNIAMELDVRTHGRPDCPCQGGTRCLFLGRAA